MFSDSTLRRISVAIVLPLLLPLLGALWVTSLMVDSARSEWRSPGPELQSKLEQGLIFAFSPLISWVNGMEKTGPPTERQWTRQAHEVLTQSPELLDLAWLISERGTTKVFRHESRTESGALPLEKIDGEIFSFVKKGARPYGFVYREGPNSFFEFQIPLQSGALFHGIILARYSLPRFLANLIVGLPPDVTLVIWKGDEALVRTGATDAGIESFFVPVDIWGKKLTFEVQHAEAAVKHPLMPLRWIGFLILMLVTAVCFLFRDLASTPALDRVSADWFASVAPQSGREAASLAVEVNLDGPLPVWAIAQKERIEEELKKEPPVSTEKP